MNGLSKKLESDEHKQRSEVLVIVQEFKKDLLNIMKSSINFWTPI